MLHKSESRVKPEPSSASAPRVLVVKLSSLGDIFHALPLVRQLRRNFGARVDWVIQTEYAELAGCFPDVERVIAFPRRGFFRHAAAFLKELRHAVGLRRMVASGAVQAKAEVSEKAALPVFKQYREADGQFYFKLTTAAGDLLLQSEAFAEGRAAGAWVKRFKTEGAAALGEAPVAVAEGMARAEVEAALNAVQAHEAQEAAAKAAKA